MVISPNPGVLEAVIPLAVEYFYQKKKKKKKVIKTNSVVFEHPLSR